ncbi:hypothetical protein HKX48_004122 [Thoreauomyces humboldtii]|nr:hypothetical protein HKX48_004122 [Thoreauomyces humboldtii]
MKKAYELATLTGTQVLLLVASESGHVYTFATPKLQPLIMKSDGKNLIQACLNAPEPSAEESAEAYPEDYPNVSSAPASLPATPLDPKPELPPVLQPSSASRKPAYSPAKILDDVARLETAVPVAQYGLPIATGNPSNPYVGYPTPGMQLPANPSSSSLLNSYAYPPYPVAAPGYVQMTEQQQQAPLHQHPSHISQLVERSESARSGASSPLSVSPPDGFANGPPASGT